MKTNFSSEGRRGRASDEDYEGERRSLNSVKAMASEAAVDELSMEVMFYDEGRHHESDEGMAAKDARVPMRASMKSMKAKRPP